MVGPPNNEKKNSWLRPLGATPTQHTSGTLVFESELEMFYHWVYFDRSACGLPPLPGRFTLPAAPPSAAARLSHPAP